jgi:hypothetical protein
VTGVWLFIGFTAGWAWGLFILWLDGRINHR